MRNIFTKLSDHHEAIHNLAVVIALIIGAIWALYTFAIETKPAMVIASKCDSYRLEDYRQLIRVTLDIENKGTGKKVYEKGVKLVSILNDLNPSKEYIDKFPNGAFDFSKFADKKIFEQLGSGAEVFDKSIVIEPGDSESFYFNYIVTPNIKNISIYASVRDDSNDIKEKGFYNSCNLTGVDANIFVQGFKEDRDEEYEFEEGQWCINREQQQQQPQQQSLAYPKRDDEDIVWCNNE